MKGFEVGVDHELNIDPGLVVLEVVVVFFIVEIGLVV